VQHQGTAGFVAPGQEPNHRHRPASLAAALAALWLVGLLAASTASAAYEQIGTFAGTLGPPPSEFPEEVQLAGVGGMAVNRTGAGGVPPGTAYTAGKNGEVAMYQPKEEGLKFVESWQFSPTSPGKNEYERCGPLPIEEGKGVACEPRVEANAQAVDVDVDQATGNVYVLNGEGVTPAGTPMIIAYKADGSEELTRFGKRAAEGKKTAETPSEIHQSIYPGGIAVGGAGTVYVFDANVPDNSYHRLMVFEPKTPGDFSEYVYAGTGSDVGAGFLGQGRFPARPVTDDAGHVYVATAANVEEYDPTNPSAGPICEFEFAQGGITSMTVDPVSEEVFFFSEKKVGGTKKIHRLGPCEGGKFTEEEVIAVAPERADLFGLAFDPEREVSASRPAGVLYGGAPGPEPAVGKGEPGQSSLGYIFARTEESPPTVGAESVSDVTASSAQLHASINPEGFPTRYAFQYITDAAYEANPPGERFDGAAEAPPGGAVLGEGGEPIPAAVTLTGLSPDTGYHYRALATSCPPEEAAPICEAAGADQSFRTRSPSPPEGRAYELVSPAQKNGGQVLPADTRLNLGSCGRSECKPGNGNTRFPMQSTAEGNAIVYEGTPFFPGQGAAVENQYFARDPQSGWHTTNLTPPLIFSKNGGGYKAFDPGLTKGLLQQLLPALSAEAPAEYPNFYLQSTSKPVILNALLRQPPSHRQPGSGPERLQLTYAGASADLSRVFFEANDALTLETPFAPEAAGGITGETNLYEWSVLDGLRLVNVAPGNAQTFPGSDFGAANLVAHAISADGSHAFWSSPGGQLYVRIDAERTQEVKDPGKFLSASADGSRVLLDDGCLYDLAAETCEDLTLDEAEVHQGGFQGLAGQSEDLSHVYFVDTAVLTEAPNAGGEEAQATKPNLYAWSEGETAFIATLAASDNANSNRGTWQPSPSSRTAEASPAGRWLAFLSQAPLMGPSLCGTPPVPCQRAFLYDSATGELHCASCNPTEAGALGASVLRQIEGAGSAMPQPRYLTDSGRLYFDSYDSLVVADTNGGAEDVYQFEPGGVGRCDREAGCVSLISGGSEAGDSNFLTIDPSGKNVFFTTRERLVAADQDELIDLYDAREGGGIAPEFKPLPCQGEACQPALPPPPESQPNTQNPTEGNPKPPKKCKKGQVRRGGKCVKKPQHKGKKGKGRAQRQQRGGSR
jgi:hypothetical protein